MDESTGQLMDFIKSIKYEYWDEKKLVYYARNPRKNDHLVEKMAGQIKEFGMPIPICITPDGTVVDGHLRLKAARALKLPQVPVAVNATWSKAQVKAFRISVNKTAEWADWDNDYLKIELDELDEEDYDLAKTGFSQKELTEVMTETNFAEEVKEEPEKEDQFKDLKMLQLFYDADTEQNFRGMIEWLDVRFQTGSLSDTVFSAVQKCVETLKTQEARKNK